jgi:glycosyltransferase involved in cell wall biosynthesis
MEGADLLVLPSFAEGVPVVLMEAMASRIPVIASRVAGVPELVEDGVSGFVIPPGDLETLTGRLGTLLGDPDLRARMGEAGRARVEAEFDIAHEGAWLAQVLGGAPGLRPEAAGAMAMDGPMGYSHPQIARPDMQGQTWKS